MASDCHNERLSIKNLIFTKALPNYVIPVPTVGYKVYGCTDCGDKFLFESSYEDHVNRKSVKITYLCKHCNQLKMFYNRCNLLCHIRSHSFKTATINVTDLKVEPLPITCYKMDLLKSTNNDANTIQQYTKNIMVSTCFECKKDIENIGVAYKDRANHFMQYTNEVYTCPICLFTLPTICALKTHIRLHLKCPPFYCPECGISISHKMVNYPYTHDCDGFKMMRATARLRCSITSCALYHPNDFKNHMKQNHLKKVFKCQFCVVACFNEATMEKHSKIHNSDLKALIFYQCELCPGRLVLQNLLETHLRNHVNTNVYPCWTCGMVCEDATAQVTHFLRSHSDKCNNTESAIWSVINESIRTSAGKHRIYRVVKKCDACHRSFIYKCKYNEIAVLPNLCPYKCASTLRTNEVDDKLICHLCKGDMSQDWEEIKKHYALFHKKYKCLDARISIPRLDIREYINRSRSPKLNREKNNRRYRRNKRNRKELSTSITTASSVDPKPSTSKDVSGLACNVCNEQFESKESLEAHLIVHKDPCMAYQCMECGQNFVVKPSFSTHLLLVHGITDADEYITKKVCYNEKALSVKSTPEPKMSEEPVGENQCKICRDQFDNAEDLEKHFRVHGMAFLKKNNSNKK